MYASVSMIVVGHRGETKNKFISRVVVRVGKRKMETAGTAGIEASGKEP